MGCDTCHVTHKNGERGKIEFESHLTKDVPALCIDCHDVKDATCRRRTRAAIRNRQLPAVPRSASVGEAEADAGVPAPPFADKMCDICHSAGEGWQSRLDQRRHARALRDLPRRQGEEDRKGESAASRRAGRMHRLPQPARRQVAGLPAARSGAVPAWRATAIRPIRCKKAHLHQPAFEQGCATCHEPHGGDNEHCCAPRATRSASSATARTRKPQKLEVRALVTIFNGNGEAARKTTSKEQGRDAADSSTDWAIRWKAIRSADMMDPTDITKVKNPIELPDLPPAARFGAARSAGEGPGKQHGVLLTRATRTGSTASRSREIRCA